MRVFVALLFVFLATKLYAEVPVDEIVSRANIIAYYQGRDGKTKANLVITDAQGRTRSRQITVLRLNIEKGKDQKYYVYFHKPADVAGMSYIVWKHANRDDDRWLYLPALDLVKRIAGSDKRSSFAGTNFLYEDISGRVVDLDIHELTSTGENYYIIKNTPRDANLVEFSYYNVKIDKNNFVPLKADYFDKAGKLYRTIETLEVKEIGGYLTITKMKATDLASNSHTICEFNDISYDIGLTEEIFMERFLRTPPSKWIKE